MHANKRINSFRPALEELEPLVLPSTLTPYQVRHAYGVDQANYWVNGRYVQGDGSGQTIAIVDAYVDPYAWRDLQTFDRQFGLPDPVFHQYYYGSVNNYNDGWSEETMLDVEWAHAIAPRANILLIDAASASSQDLYTAVNWVRQQPGVSAVSMSWGGSEAGQTGYDWVLTTPWGHNGITFFASAGDHGAQCLYPAMSPNVVAVGGTTLTVDAYGNYQGETGWGGSGGGISNYEREPGYQYSVQSSGRRTGPDVAYNAGTSVWVAWTRPTTGSQGWISVGGTSAGAPQWAGIMAIADQIRIAAGEHTLDGPSQTLYALYNSVMTPDFHDITTGYNGYWAHGGYDLVTGRGTPYAQNVILDLARVNDGFHGPTYPGAQSAGSPTIGSLYLAENSLGHGLELPAMSTGSQSASVQASPTQPQPTFSAPTARHSGLLQQIDSPIPTTSNLHGTPALANVSLGSPHQSQVGVDGIELTDLDSLFATKRSLDWLDA
jgi:subtilase family serine protease